MKKIILVFLIILLINCGCGKDSKTIKVDNLILEQESIDTIAIYKNQEGKPTWILNDSEEIKKLIKMVKDISVEKLTKEKDIEFMQNGQKLLEDGILIINMFHEEMTTGQFLIWSDGKIYVIDTKSMTGKERTISYLSKKEYPEIYELLIKTPIQD